MSGLAVFCGNFKILIDAKYWRRHVNLACTVNPPIGTLPATSYYNSLTLFQPLWKLQRTTVRHKDISLLNRAQTLWWFGFFGKILFWMYNAELFYFIAQKECSLIWWNIIYIYVSITELIWKMQLYVFVMISEITHAESRAFHICEPVVSLCSVWGHN